MAIQAIQEQQQTIKKLENTAKESTTGKLQARIDELEATVKNQNAQILDLLDDVANLQATMVNVLAKLG